MTTTVDIQKLETQANELRAAMVEALGAADDAKVRKLGNELAAVNKQLIEALSESQNDAKAVYLELMHDALVGFERDGLTLTVKYSINDEGQEAVSTVFHVTGALMDEIKAEIAQIDRPSTATKWEYGRDEKGEHSFDFGRGPRKVGTTSGDGTKTTGWLKDGQEVSLGDAFDACATPAQKTELEGKSTGSQKHAFKSKVVTDGGYTKK